VAEHRDERRVLLLAGGVPDLQLNIGRPTFTSIDCVETPTVAGPSSAYLPQHRQLNARLPNTGVPCTHALNGVRSVNHPVTKTGLNL
jgi:hypothetical protein